MLRTLSVEKFRGLDTFSMDNLGRINLLVGTNNCGKTSMLEAIQLLATRGDVRSLWSTLIRRGEYFEQMPRMSPSWTDAGIPEADICHLFHGHQLSLGASFSIRGDNDKTSDTLKATIVEATNPGSSESPNAADVRQAALAFNNGEATPPGRLALVTHWRQGRALTSEHPVLLSRRGGIRFSQLERASPQRDDDAKPTRLITTANLDRDVVVSHFERIVLKPEEKVVIEALQTIEPTIERIASLSGDGLRVPYSMSDRGGIVVKCSDSTQPIPIGSMGDGIWRMLGIVLSLLRTQNGTLLVDEIDTGFHYSVLTNMWKLVLQTAQRLNVQVFATTHSRDCYESLASISRTDVVEPNDVSIQRIERGRKEAVAFTEPEIVIAAQQGIEVR